MKRLRYLKISDIFAPFIFLLLLVPSLVARLFLLISKKDIWLICEDGHTARDNGYHFFKYMMENKKNVKTYYVINKKEADYKKIRKYDKNIISFKSLKHWFYYMIAKRNISIHKHGNPCQSFWYIMHVKLRLYDNRIFLQHGITKDKVLYIYFKNARFRIFICGAKKEYEFIKSTFGYPKNRVKYTGFARFDNLHDNSVNKKQILLMPTWRNWLGGNLITDDGFLKDEYYIKWNNILSNENLNSFLKENDIELYFYPHQHMQKYLKYFNTSFKNIKIVDNSKVDIQTLLKESALLITDYSSVYMDFAYMNKPVIYYQFDEEKFRSGHLEEGYFNYRRDAFGPILTKEDEVVDSIINLYKNDYKDEEIYEERRKDFFELRDNKNCERIYKAIKGSE